MDPAYQAQGVEDVLIVAHEVHLPYCCQRLLLGDLGGPGDQAQPLAAHTDGAAANDDDVMPCVDVTSSQDYYGQNMTAEGS